MTPKPLEVQTLLRNSPTLGEGIRELDGVHGVTVGREGDLLILNYGQTDSPRGGLADECRGLILRVPSIDVVSYSFRRFYNHGEGHAAHINWNTARVLEKVDGTLIVFYHNGEEWTFQTRGVIDASGEIGDRTETFRSRVLALLKVSGFESPDDLMECLGVWRSICVVCEYVGPFNRIVTPYPLEDLYLLSATYGDICSEVSTENIPWPWSWPREYPLQGALDKVLDSLGDLEPMAEGYVVVDDAGNRIKVKNPRYLALHGAIQAGERPTEKNFARLAILGDTVEIRGAFPQYASRILIYEAEIVIMWNEAAEAWYRHRDLGSQKDFALAVKHLPLAPWLFQKRAGKTELTAREWVRENMRPERLVEIVERKGVQDVSGN